MDAGFTAALGEGTRTPDPTTLLVPRNAYHDSDHPNISSFWLPPANSQEYSANLFRLMSSPNLTQLDSRHTKTGISKAPLILGLDPTRSLGVPLTMTTDIMHLIANISQLLIDLWHGSVTCLATDSIKTWDWAIFRDEQIW